MSFTEPQLCDGDRGEKETPSPLLCCNVLLVVLAWSTLHPRLTYATLLTHHRSKFILVGWLDDPSNLIVSRSKHHRPNLVSERPNRSQIYLIFLVFGHRFLWQDHRVIETGFHQSTRTGTKRNGRKPWTTPKTRNNTRYHSTVCERERKWRIHHCSLTLTEKLYRVRSKSEKTSITTTQKPQQSHKPLISFS